MSHSQPPINTDFKIPVSTEDCLGCSETYYYLTELRYWKKKPFFLTCESCHFEQLDVYCSSCDDHFLTAAKSRPTTVNCPPCKTTYSIPQSIYDQATPLVFTESLPISTYLKLVHYGFETELLASKFNQPIYEQADCGGCDQERLYLTDFDQTQGNVLLICKVCHTVNNELRCPTCKSHHFLNDDQIQKRKPQLFCEKCKNTFTLPKNFYENLQLLLTKEEVPKELWPEEVYEEPSHWQCQNCYKTHLIPKTYYQQQKEQILTNDVLAKAFLSQTTGHAWQCPNCQETDDDEESKNTFSRSHKIKFYSREAGFLFFCPLMILIYAYQRRTGIRAWTVTLFSILCWSILLILFFAP